MCSQNYELEIDGTSTMSRSCFLNHSKSKIPHEYVSNFVSGIIPNGKNEGKVQEFHVFSDIHFGFLSQNSVAYYSEKLLSETLREPHSFSALNIFRIFIPNIVEARENWCLEFFFRNFF